ncbi:MAG: hypothetical protein ACQERM_01295 [Methanobacteriota archaeon]
MSGADSDWSTVGPGGPWTPFLAGAAAVLVASVLPVPDLLAGSGSGTGGGAPVGPLALLGPTGVFHLVGYAGLTVLAARAIVGSRGGVRGGGGLGVRGALLAASASVAVGFCAELLQSQIAWRSFAWTDAAVNAVGAGFGVAAVAGVLALRGDARGDSGER